MSDEIFDYFGGKSPRKVEPLEDDDFFGDLMAKDEAEPQPSEDSSAEDKSAIETETKISGGQESKADRSMRASADTADKANEPEAEPVAGSHWDSLASTFGIAAAPSPSRPARETEPVEIIDAEIVDDEIEVETEKAPARASKVENRSRAGKKPTAKRDSDDVLSEMFTPDADEPSSDSGRGSKSKRAEVTAEVYDDDDPFAAFHRSNEPEPTEDDPSAEIIEEDEEVDTLVVTDDFVEFDVKDLSSGKSEPRKRRRSRGPKSDDRGDSNETRERKPRNERNRSRNKSGRDQDEQSHDEGGERNQGGRGERGGRNQGGRGKRNQGERSERNQGNRGDRNQGERNQGDRGERNEGDRGERNQEDSGERNQGGRGRGGNDRPPRRKRPEREGANETRGRRGRGRNSERAEAVDDDSNDDGDSRRKKPKVPTWEDAINGVVEKNIRRHGSNKSNNRRGGGGGSRRRR